MIASSLRWALAAALLLVAGGCSETMLRRDSLSEVRIAGQDVLVSWVEVPPDGIDLFVLGSADGKPLDPDTARAAAGRVAAGRCLLDRVHAVLPPVEYPGGTGFAFRYVCGGSAPPAQDLPG